MNTIGSTQLAPPAQIKPLTTQQAENPSAFREMLVDSIQQVNQMQQQADKAVEQLFTGGDVNPAEVLTAVQKADLAFRMVMQVRNKLVQAYQEVRDIRI